MPSLINKLKDLVTDYEPTDQNQTPISRKEDFSPDTILSEIETLFSEGSLDESSFDERSQADVMNELEVKTRWFETEFDAAAQEIPSLADRFGEDRMDHDEYEAAMDSWIDEYLTDEFVTNLNETIDLAKTIIACAFDIEGENADWVEDFNDKVGDYPALHYMHNAAVHVRATVANYADDE